MLQRLLRRAFLLIVWVAVGCGDDATGPAFETALGVDITVMTRTASGLYVLDQTVGAGAQAQTGNQVNVRYSGWLESGRRFDAGDYAFRLGRREAIDGFDEGVTGMRVGGKRRIVIPPSLGYGAQGIQGQIPPNAYLLFDLELLSAGP